MQNFQDVINLFMKMIAQSMILLYAFAFAAFFYGVVKFILNAEVEKERNTAKEWMTWSIVALFVMVSIWGIVGILVNTFGISPLLIPQLPSSGV